MNRSHQAYHKNNIESFSQCVWFYNIGVFILQRKGEELLSAVEGEVWWLCDAVVAPNLGTHPCN